MQCVSIRLFHLQKLQLTSSKSQLAEFKIYKAKLQFYFTRMNNFIIESLLLGLSTGTYCTMYCAPVLIPFLFGHENPAFKKNTTLLSVFLAGRFLMYLVLGAALGCAGLLASNFFDPVLARYLSYAAYIFCGTVLLISSLGPRFPWKKNITEDSEKLQNTKSCKTKNCMVKILTTIQKDWFTALMAGFATGLHICPPLWAAIARSIFGGYGIPGLFYLMFFYAGTLPFFIPLLFVPFISRAFSILKRIAQITQLLLVVYFIVFAGIMQIFF